MHVRVVEPGDESAALRIEYRRCGPAPAIDVVRVADLNDPIADDSDSGRRRPLRIAGPDLRPRHDQVGSKPRWPRAAGGKRGREAHPDGDRATNDAVH